MPAGTCCLHSASREGVGAREQDQGQSEPHVAGGSTHKLSLSCRHKLEKDAQILSCSHTRRPRCHHSCTHLCVLSHCSIFISKRGLRNPSPPGKMLQSVTLTQLIASGRSQSNRSHKFYQEGENLDWDLSLPLATTAGSARWGREGSGGQSGALLCCAVCLWHSVLCLPCWLPRGYV